MTNSIRLRQLYGEDVFSFPQINLSLENRGLLRVEGENRDLGGSNGAGKSNIFRLLTWTLFGKCPGYPTADEIIREDLDHNPIVGKSHGFIHIVRGQDEILVYRYRRHATYGNKVFVSINGADKTADADAHTTAVIAEAIGCDYDTFVTAVMFPQGDAGFGSKTPNVQASLMDKICRTGRFETARKHVKKLVADLSSEIAQEQAVIQHMGTSAFQLEQRASEMQARELQFSEQRQAKIAQLEYAVASIQAEEQSDLTQQFRDREAALLRHVGSNPLEMCQQQLEIRITRIAELQTCLNVGDPVAEVTVVKENGCSRLVS